MKYEYEYPMPGLTVDVAVVMKTHDGYDFLLIERSDGKGWALPGGFVNPNENVYQAAIRELKEETTIDVFNLKNFKYLGVYSEPGRDPRGWTVSHLFLYNHSSYGSYPRVKASDDAVNHKWVNYESIKLGVIKLAFDHRQMVLDTYENLEKK